MQKEPMGSRELGLVIAQHLLDLDDMHYGYWDGDLPVTIQNFEAAQQRYTDVLLGTLPDPKPEAGTEAEIETEAGAGAEARRAVRVLDIGCGSGHMMQQVLARGYACDGIVPAADLAKIARERLAPLDDPDAQIFECRFEDLPESQCRNQYDVCLFSESFQYVTMPLCIQKLPSLLKPGGLVVICDFFKSPNHGDGRPGDRSMGGGKRLHDFYDLIAGSPFEIKRDDDITRFVSPNMDLVSDLLAHRIAPAVDAVERFLVGRYPRFGRLLLRVFRRPLEIGKQKYLAGTRNRDVFERYKTYKLIVLELIAPA